MAFYIHKMITLTQRIDIGNSRSCSISLNPTYRYHITTLFAHVKLGKPLNL